MNILHPTLGDLIDRYTIVDMKSLVDPRFDAERRELTEAIAKRTNGLDLDVLVRHSRQLHAIHTQIWNINVQLERLAREVDPQPSLGVSAWRLNQERILVLEQLDTLSGEFTRPEKVY